MTDDRKTADYADLLSRAENETHRSGMWADSAEAAEKRLAELTDEIQAGYNTLCGLGYTGVAKTIFGSITEALASSAKGEKA